MGMNNIYYRFLHLVEDAEYAQHAGAPAHERDRQPRHRQARLRADLAGGVGDQRLRHVRGLAREAAAEARGRREAIQSAVRIAATVHAVGASVGGRAADSANSAPGAPAEAAET